VTQLVVSDLLQWLMGRLPALDFVGGLSRHELGHVAGGDGGPRQLLEEGRLDRPNHSQWNARNMARFYRSVMIEILNNRTECLGSYLSFPTTQDARGLRTPSRSL
jgi:hypothetical protein